MGVEGDTLVAAEASTDLQQGLVAGDEHVKVLFAVAHAVQRFDDVVHRHQHRQPNKRTNQMLPHTQRTHPHINTSILNNQNLSHRCNHLYNNKELVVAEMLEDVDLPVLDLSGVDLVENLKQDEDVEENTVVLSCLIVPISNLNG